MTSLNIDNHATHLRSDVTASGAFEFAPDAIFTALRRRVLLGFVALATLAGPCSESFGMEPELVHQEPSKPLAAPPLPQRSPFARPDTMRDCDIGVERSRTLVQTLPEGDLSRYFAERMLQQALTEAGNREFDDCVEWAEQAALEIMEHRHQLQPGETLDILKADR
ncbi:MAG: hypothetical protein JWL62_382 [Hyphomicrobiales bacterium]|nr:hypothetical protein [Hyphomicrobiales bacterium]